MGFEKKYKFKNWDFLGVFTYFLKSMKIQDIYETKYLKAYYFRKKNSNCNLGAHRTAKRKSIALVDGFWYSN